MEDEFHTHDGFIDWDSEAVKKILALVREELVDVIFPYLQGKPLIIATLTKYQQDFLQFLPRLLNIQISKEEASELFEKSHNFWERELLAGVKMGFSKDRIIYEFRMTNALYWNGLYYKAISLGAPHSKFYERFKHNDFLHSSENEEKLKITCEEDESNQPISEIDLMETSKCKRKIGSANNSYYIYLPVKWVRELHLQKGDEVLLTKEVTKDKTLIHLSFPKKE